MMHVISSAPKSFVEKGTNRNRFFRGQVDKYTWVDLGSSYLPSDVLAAFLFAQFEHRDQIQSQRKAQSGIITMNVSLTGLRQRCEATIRARTLRAIVAHVLYADAVARSSPGAHSSFEGTGNPQRVPLFTVTSIGGMGQRWGGKEGDCPVTENISDRVVRLPFYNELDEVDQARVVSADY